MVIEMYFHGTGGQGVWGNEHFREIPLGNPEIDDYLIKLQAFPQYATINGDIPLSDFFTLGSYFWEYTEFTIDLKGIWQRAADHFGRSSFDQLYAVALDVESGRVFNPNPYLPPTVFAEVNQIRVTYTPLPPVDLMINAKSTYSTGFIPLRAMVTIDGTYRGDTPLTVSLPKGVYTLEVSEYVYKFYPNGGADIYKFYGWGDHVYTRQRSVALETDTILEAFYQYYGYDPDAGGGAGGGNYFLSPALFIWNGSKYIKEIILDLHGDSDVTIRHKIRRTPVPEDNHYMLSLLELNQSVSYIDYVKLYAVDSEGMMHENPLVGAKHSEFGNVKQLLKSDDDNRVELSPSQIIDLRFGAPEIENIAYFVFEIQGYEPK